MYPTTIFEVEDRTGRVDTKPIPETIINEVIVSSTEKGPEDMLYLKGDTFYDLFGRDKDLSFAKHGQPIIQAVNAIENGATILFKRLVASDATLANLAILAKVEKKEVQKRDEDGNFLYLDPVTGEETTEIGTGNAPALHEVCHITYLCESVLKAQNMEECVETIYPKLADDSEADEDAKLDVCIYPLFIVTDNGRGNSRKRVRISPDYKSSKYKDYMKYSFSVIENNEIIESCRFNLDHNYVEGEENNSLENAVKQGVQVKCKMFEDCFELFFNKVAELSGNAVEEIIENDLFFGKNKLTQQNIDNVVVDLTNGFNLSFIYGIDLPSGDNGAFKNSPFGTEQWTSQAVSFFNGEYTNKMYDLYNAPMDLVIDANYPKPVKKAIESMVLFREDVLYMRDSGTNLFDKADIVQYNEEFSNSKYISPYHNSYEVKDPVSKKHVRVTIGYSLTRLMVNHFRKGRNRPIAGFLHEMTIPEAIEGTLNFSPSISPNLDEKQDLEDARINYASYYENTLVLETFFTSQLARTDFSYANNVLAVQELMKAIRNRCPRIRYSFLNADDFTNYKEDVEAIIEKYRGNFAEAKFEYVQDQANIQDKIFYGVIYISFRPFVQAEKFKLIALPYTA